jgi:hypothetical protein
MPWSYRSHLLPFDDGGEQKRLYGKTAGRIPTQPGMPRHISTGRWHYRAELAERTMTLLAAGRIL